MASTANFGGSSGVLKSMHFEVSARDAFEFKKSILEGRTNACTNAWLECRNAIL